MVSDLGVLILSVNDWRREDSVSDSGLEVGSAEVGDGPLRVDNDDRGNLVSRTSSGAGLGFLPGKLFLLGDGSGSQVSI